MLSGQEPCGHESAENGSTKQISEIHEEGIEVQNNPFSHPRARAHLQLRVFLEQSNYYKTNKNKHLKQINVFMSKKYKGCFLTINTH
jgi:hypothetical protein